ncbi:hypothetical protein OPIT5_07785 [Opitutaceae bacterium TAV5]|nr:hypothetical protein OPIT5_07785 [Opitutaceae bacterium TAV5]
MKIRIFDNARFDLLDGFAFYEKQECGVGQYFLDSLYADVDTLEHHAGIHPKKFGGFHWMLSRRFPYAIYYTIEDNTVLVHAILDCRQNPAKIRERLLREQTRHWT